MEPLGIGIVGSGNISSIYLQNLPAIPGAVVRGIADMRPAAAEAQGQRFGVAAMAVDALLARDDIHIVVNLTIPAAHADVSLAALSAGKHVFSEKPLAVDVATARRVVAEADARKLMLGSAPDTFLGGGGRLARRLVDEGSVGRIITGTAMLMSHGMEHWHPDPEFFFKKGAGPVLDVGPYYIVTLINLLGPVTRVHSVTATGFPERTVTAAGAKRGARILVETPTTASSLLEFESGAQIVFVATWDVWKHSHPPIELYGTEGSLRVPDPNFYGGTVETSERDGDWQPHLADAMPLGVPNWPDRDTHRANYRALGVAEMVSALRHGTPHHSDGKLALHALEVMEAVITGGSATMSAGTRPPVLAEDAAAALFSGPVGTPA